MAKMSPAARKRVSEASKQRWANYRAAKAAGTLPARSKPGPKPGTRTATTAFPTFGLAPMTLEARPATGRRPGRPKTVRRVTVTRTGGEFAGQSLMELVALRRTIDLELADRTVRQYSV